jgi:hypothetical protein
MSAKIVTEQEWKRIVKMITVAHYLVVRAKRPGRSLASKVELIRASKRLYVEAQAIGAYR